METTLRWYLGQNDLNITLVNQNEDGLYWTHPNRTLWSTILAKFNKGIGKPGDVKSNTDGSHKAYPQEAAIDFKGNSGTALTSNESLKINGYRYIKGYKLPYAVELVYGNHHFLATHMICTHKVGYRTKPGEIIAKIMTAAENKASGRFDPKTGLGFPPHFHFGTITTGSFAKETVRDFVLAPVKPPTPIPPQPTPDQVRIKQLEAAFRSMVPILENMGKEIINLSKIISEQNIPKA